MILQNRIPIKEESSPTTKEDLRVDARAEAQDSSPAAFCTQIRWLEKSVSVENRKKLS
jgi:hypothetical protein